MLVQDYLREKGIDSLVAEFAIDVRRHQQYPNLVLFKYSMIDSPMGNPVVQECRGLILDESKDWEVVSRSFDKFFNYGEGHHPPVPNNPRDTILQEKKDGSLCVLYFYDGMWRVQTSGSPDAGGQVHAEAGMTFADLFWSTFSDMGYKVPVDLHRDLCFAFELTSQYNRIVVQHAAPRVTLIGVRNRVSGEEYDPEVFSGLYESVKTFIPHSIKEISESFSSMSPVSQEGYVMMWREGNRFNRVKIKHPGYVALHHMRDSTTDKAFYEVIRSGESSELLTYFPEYTNAFNLCKTNFDKLAQGLKDRYKEIEGIKDQKEFAQGAVKSRVSAALFQLRSGKVSTVEQFLRKMPIDKLMEAAVS